VTIPYERHDDLLGEFFRSEARDRVRGLSEQALWRLFSIGVSLEPFVQVAPLDGAPVPFVPGFEGVALGPDGESFAELIEEAADLGVDGELMRLGMLLALLQTARGLEHSAGVAGLLARAGATVRAGRVPPPLITANLDEELLSSPLLDAALGAVPAPPDRLVLEVNERLPAAAVDRVIALSERHRVGLALDDVECMEPDVRARLLAHARIVKVSADHSREILADPRPDVLLQALSRIVHPGCPTVLEGLSRESEHRFLREVWHAHWGPLWVQSHANRDTGPWSVVLKPLSEHRRRGGFYLPATTPNAS
jgi:EAL domain-containing protein (putative c-di-GMP-specific phosphodiesterase class I)